MKKRMRIIAGLLTLFGAGVFALAQEQPKGDSTNIEQQLSLTEGQTGQFEKIRESYKPRFKEIMMDKSLSVDQKSKKLNDLRDEVRKEEKKVLTPEQVSRLEELEKKTN